MDKFTEKTLGCERKYAGKIICTPSYCEELIRSGTILDSKTLSAWACYRLMT